jgi:hypothetical protein
LQAIEFARKIFNTNKKIKEGIDMHIQTSNQEKLDLGFNNFTCNWGTHICGLYETEEERDEIVMGFLHAGDLAGDMQMYCPAERRQEDFVEKYDKNFPDCCGHTLDDKKFNISSAKELYYPDGHFSPRAMDKGLGEFFVESQKGGKRNIRATAEMVWALEAIPGVEDLMIYESRLNYFIPGKPWISICLYNTTKFSGSTIMRVLQTHPFIITKQTITQNPFYQDPDKWLKENAPSYINKK